MRHFSLVLLSAFCSATALSVDWAVFRGTADSGRVELFYAVPYHLLEYTPQDSGLVAQFSVRFQMRGSQGYSQDAVIYKQARISSFREASQSRRSFVDGFSLQAPAGRYWYSLTLGRPAARQNESMPEAVDYVAVASVEDTIEVLDLGQGFALSSVQLAAGLAVDSTGGGFSVIPNPARRYGGDGLDYVYFYYEAYDMAAMPDSYQVQASVLKTSVDRRRVDTVLTTGPISKHKTGTKGASVLGVSVAGLSAGSYELLVEVYDPGRKESRSRRTTFLVGEEEQAAVYLSPYRLQMTELEKKYYRQLSYIASRRELSYYNSLSDSGKEAYLAWFWSRHNLSEFARRMQTAETKFRTSRTSGLATDRGRIYVKYGAPDEVEHRVLEVDRKPREYWRYYGLGYLFIFIDVGGDGNFRLAYSSNPDEPKTGYEHLLAPDEQELLK